jgi:hypothetical protein
MRWCGVLLLRGVLRLGMSAALGLMRRRGVLLRGVLLRRGSAMFSGCWSAMFSGCWSAMFSSYWSAMFSGGGTSSRARFNSASRFSVCPRSKASPIGSGCRMVDSGAKRMGIHRPIAPIAAPGAAADKHAMVAPSKA